MGSYGVPDNISEEYYQIGELILFSFSKYRPSLDLFYFNEKVMQLIPFSKKGDRLSNEQVEKLAELCGEGNIFVSRSDHPIYSQHIVKQLDLILVDRNLKEREIADICTMALLAGVNSFFKQPVRMEFEKLESDVKVVTEYLWKDKHRIRLFLRRLWKGKHSLAHHSLNTMILGLWLLIKLREKELSRKIFDDAAMGFLLHDVGMTKIPDFILNKTKPLTPDEKNNILPHVLNSISTVHKVDLISDVSDKIILEHHERLDGSGYPQRKTDISFYGRLAGVVDAFSAMIQDKPYGEALSLDNAGRDLASQGSKFDIVFSGSLLAAVVEGRLASLEEKK